MATQKRGMQGWGPAATIGLAFAAGAMSTLIAQHHQLKKLHLRLERSEQSHNEQQRHINLANQQRLLWELLSKAMEDSTLAAVLDVHDGRIPPAKHRQFLFANAVYTNALLAYRIGNVNQAELFGHLRSTVQNPIFREYWEVTRLNRASLEYNSVEARVGRLMDGLIRELDEADTEEWWVVGNPPE